MIDLTSLSLKFLHKKNKTTLDRILNETTLKVSRHLLPKIDKLVSVKTTVYPKHRQLNKLLQQNLSLKTPELVEIQHTTLQRKVNHDFFRATRAACNHNLLVEITDAWHVYSQLRLELHLE